MTFRTAAWIAVLGLGLNLTVGCGPTKEGESVTGTVTLDGKPLDDGRIAFVPTDKTGTAEGAPIKNGKYSLRVKAGPKLVQITSQKVVGKKKPYPDDPKSPEYDDIQQFLPARYNSETELKCEVKAGANDIPFKLELPKDAAPPK